MVYVNFFHGQSTICDRNWLKSESERSITITRLGVLLFICIMMNRSSKLLLVVIDVTESHPIHVPGYYKEGRNYFSDKKVSVLHSRGISWVIISSGKTVPKSASKTEAISLLTSPVVVMLLSKFCTSVV